MRLCRKVDHDVRMFFFKQFVHSLAVADISLHEAEIRISITGASVLMDACRKYGIQRYHQVSTDEVYGDLPLDRPDMFFTEETPIHTSSVPAGCIEMKERTAM